MISEQDVDRIAERWVEDFSVDPYVVRQREMDAWHELDELVYDRPGDALLVFERIAEMDLIDWTFEGIAIGPLETFLALHRNLYEQEISAIRQRNRAFDEMYAIALQGL